MKNSDIREYAKENGIYLWQIADALNIPDSSFSRKMRHELNTALKARIMQIIKEMAGEKSE